MPPPQVGSSGGGARVSAETVAEYQAGAAGGQCGSEQGDEEAGHGVLQFVQGHPLIAPLHYSWPPPGLPRRAPPPGHADLVGVPRSDRTCAPQPTPPSPLFTASSTVEAAARRCCKRSEARHFFRIVEICMNNICALRY
jgi:hypothetical protein